MGASEGVKWENGGGWGWKGETDRCRLTSLEEMLTKLFCSKVQRVQHQHIFHHEQILRVC